MYRFTIPATALCLLSSIAQAQDWQPVTDPAVLTNVMSNTTMRATFPDGEQATAIYDEDGTGELQAWGETFQRTWEVKGVDQVCITEAKTVNCYKVSTDGGDTSKILIENTATGEQLVVNVTARGDNEVALETEGSNTGGAAKPSAEEVAASLANPNTPMASMTLKLQQRAFEGNLPNASDQSSTTLLFQPALPFKVGDGQVFFRPALPYVFGQPLFDAGSGDFDDESGFGDLGFDLAYGETLESGVLWAAGIFSSLPIGSDGLSNDLYTLGPEFLVGKITSDYVLGFFPNHQWDVGGSGDGDVNLTTIQLFGTIIGRGGWTYGTAPIMTYDHNESQWTIPVNLNVGKTVIASNGRPWKLGFEINYYVENADPFGPEWMASFSIAPVIANPLAKWFQ